jgi:uncharacterized protein YjiS (DUF1127 family)
VPAIDHAGLAGFKGSLKMSQATLHYAVPPVRPLPAVSIGRVKRSYVAGDLRPVGEASNDTDYLPELDSVALEAWAARSAASSGFGDAVVDRNPPANAAVIDGAFASGAAVSASLKEIATTIAAATAAAVRRLFTAWKNWRDQLATVNTLRALDARTLRDLGIDPSEVRSVAVELSGASDPTRAHALMTLRHLAH